MENAIRFIELRDQINPKTRIWMRMIIQEKNAGEWPDYKSFWKKRIKQTDRVYSRTIFNWGEQLKGFQAVAESCEMNLPCVALWSLLVIFNTGDVPLCNADFNLKYPLGSVKERSIADLWRSESMMKQRIKHLEGRKGNIDICMNCNVWDEPGVEDKISIKYAESQVVGKRKTGGVKETEKDGMV
jgi:radical SAM protein with 4Fe4S-binding SPASM domain